MLLNINPEDFSDEERLAAQLLATKDSNDMTNEQIANECNVAPRTLYRWQSREEFIALLNHYAELAQDAFIPELYSLMRKSVRSGSTRAMELALKNRGKLIDRKEVSGNLDITARSAESLSQNNLQAEIEELKRKVGKLSEAKKSALPPVIIDAELVENGEKE